MKKRMLGLLLVLALLAAALCTTVLAAGGAVYVSNTGSDTTGDGSQASPYATLAKAVTEAEDGSTIYVMSDLTMTKCARFYDKSLTITSLGDTAHTISRGGDFAQQQDNARSTYNPAMIEVQTINSPAGLTLTNIILDDADKHEGSVFAQANTIEDKTNTDYVQDAMIASNATCPTTITLGDGAVLRNFGGMSAVRVTGQAKLVMQSGSVIEDTDSHTTRTRGKVAGEVGPAGAVWIQGASFEMEAGATIQNVDGRAVYVDGGSATIGGTISGITANSQMWQGADGVAVHLRSELAASTKTSLELSGTISDITGTSGHVIHSYHSDVTMRDGATIKNCALNGDSSLIRLLCSSTLTMDEGSKLCDSNMQGIYSTNEGAAAIDIDVSAYPNTIVLNGELCGLGLAGSHKNSIKLAYSTLTIGASGNIHDNYSSYGVYVQGFATLDLYGKIYNNTSSGRGGGIGTAGHNKVEINIYDGAEIKNNTATKTGGGISMRNGKLTMYGGEISGNSTEKIGGGIYLYSDAVADLRGGTITGNTDKNGSNDLAVTDNGCYATSTNNYLFISDDMTIGNKAVYFEMNTKTVTPADNSFDIKLGNASENAVTALTRASTDRGWGTPLATFWAQRDGAATLTVGGLTLSDLPVYVLTLPVNATDGKPTDTEAKCYAATRTADGVQFTIPEADLANGGCAIAIVQPTEYYGDLVITADKTTLTYDEAAKTYTITYTETFTLSENLKSQLLNKELGVYMNEVKITLLPDLRLPMDIPMYTFESSIFECKTITGTTGGGANSFTANCVLKDGWEAHLSEPTVLTVIAVLDQVDFKAGDMLATTGEVVINPEIDFTPNDDAAVAEYALNNGQLPEAAPLSNVYIPGNVCTTLMLAQEDEGGEDEPNQPTGGFFFPMGEEHIAYVSGYPDGTVRPEANITRAESAAMLYRLMPRGYFASGAQTPADVTTSDWYYSIVSQMVGSGYLTGYADGTFRGNNNVTRAEFVTMLVRLSGARGGWCSFTDVSATHWAYDAISTAAAEGWIGGYADGSFRPDQAITRAEAMTIINRALDRGVDETSWLGDYINWPDNPRDAWYYYEVIEATNDHYYTGSRPNEDWVG